MRLIQYLSIAVFALLYLGIGLIKGLDYSDYLEDVRGWRRPFSLIVGIWFGLVWGFFDAVWDGSIYWLFI